MEKSNNVVTGGAGFIGSHISRHLLQRGGTVRIIDNFSTGREENIARLKKQFPGRLEVFRSDIRDLKETGALLAEVDTVYHQGALPSVQRSVEDPSRDKQC